MDTLDFDNNDPTNHCSPNMKIGTTVRESTIETKVTANAKTNGWLSYKWVSPSQRGVPDRMYFKNGSLVIVEFKAPGKLPTPYQQAIHRKLKAVGFIVHIIDDIEKGKALLC